MMAVGYLLLIVYFLAKGGYQIEVLAWPKAAGRTLYRRRRGPR